MSAYHSALGKVSMSVLGPQCYCTVIRSCQNSDIGAMIAGYNLENLLSCLCAFLQVQLKHGNFSGNVY